MLVLHHSANELLFRSQDHTSSKQLGGLKYYVEQSQFNVIHWRGIVLGMGEKWMNELNENTSSS